MERVQQNTYFSRVLDWCEERESTDLHAQTNEPYCIRVHGELLRIPLEAFAAPVPGEISQHLRETFSSDACDRIESRLEVDLSFYFREQRYRANFSKQRGEQSFSFRIVPQQEWGLRDLQLPKSLKSIVDHPRGLLLLTGPTGQGKSTTVRALLQELNGTSAMRVITIEDPIEYVFTNGMCQFEQREVGIDTASFSDGVRNAMRQDPDVIFIGEMRDRETVRAAMQAAETGHLVLTTLHADSVAQALGRIREFYTSEERDNISSLLARNLHAIVNQRLIPNRKGTRTPCLEIMKRGPGVQSAIVKNELQMLTGIIEQSVNDGMHTFDQYLRELFAAEIIDEETALQFAVNRHRFELVKKGIVTFERILQPLR
jgi:twitching motility protein PilT